MPRARLGSVSLLSDSNEHCGIHFSDQEIEVQGSPKSHMRRQPSQILTRD